MILTHDLPRHNSEAILFPQSVYIIVYVLNLVAELPAPLSNSLPTAGELEELEAELGDEDQ